MSRLFWKLFFSFWLALLVAGVGVGVAVWAHHSDRDVATGEPMRMLVRFGEDMLHAGGVDALRPVLERLQREGPFPLYAVDDAGHELLERPVSAETLATVTAEATSDDPRPVARRVTLADGRSLMLFIPAGNPLFEAPVLRLPPEGDFPPPPPEDDFMRPPPNGDFPPPPPDGRFSPPPPPPESALAPWLLITMGLFASTLFSALLAWYLVRPIRHLRHAFEAAAQGDLDARVQPLIGERRDEIADLGRDYDQMAARLKELIGAQLRLFHDVSHELRSPLARLQAAVGLLRQGHGDTETALERVERETGRLDELVGELLLLARLEAGMPGANLSRFDLLDLLEGIMEDARFEAGQLGCRIEFSAPGSLPVEGRPDLLGRAIENVVRNAIKYTIAGGTVRVEVRSDVASRQFCLNVRDQGAGIAEEDLDAIFEPFFRARGSGSAYNSGYGLGLAIARRAVEAHGGTIQARNGDDGGLNVEICLPLAG